MCKKKCNVNFYEIINYKCDLSLRSLASVGELDTLAGSSVGGREQHEFYKFQNVKCELMHVRFPLVVIQFAFVIAHTTKKIENLNFN